jgi:glutaredoxin
MIDLKKWSRVALKEASERLLQVADRADELGGELRDQVKEKLRTSTRLANLKKSYQENLVPQSHTVQRNQVENKTTPVPREAEVFSFGDARKAAQVFGARSCSWSGRSLRLFESAGIKATYLDLDLAGSDSIREELRVETGQLTIPYIYLRGRFIGGFNALDEIERLGQLAYYVLPEAERLTHPDHGKVNISPRTSNVDALNGV